MHRISDYIKNKSVYRAILRILLAVAIVCFSFVVKRFCEAGQGAEIYLDTDRVVADHPLVPLTRHIWASEIKSCVWYVGEQEVSRTEEIVPYVPQSGDIENLIRVCVTLKDGTSHEASLYYSVLPVLYMNSDTGYDEVVREPSTSVDMKLTGKADDLPDELYDGKAYIHIRGNASGTMPKHPFKIKLEEKGNLLGLGETRHWVLLANAIDSTLLRNKLVYDFSGAIGADCQMNSENVTLIYNGEYQGVYQLCEQIRVDENSINVYDWEDSAQTAAEKIAKELVYKRMVQPGEKTQVQNVLESDLLSDFSWMETHTFDFPYLRELNETEARGIPTEYDLTAYIDFDSLPKATGGVLLEMDYFTWSEKNLMTRYGLPFYFRTPYSADTYPELYAYIQEYLQALEYSFHDTDFTYHNASPHYQVLTTGYADKENGYQRTGVMYRQVPFTSENYEGCHYSELIDFNSLLTNFLVCEYAMNWDSMKNSVFLYKDIDGPFYIGPAWDYDWSWGNSNYDIYTWLPTTWHTTDDYIANELYYQTIQWNRYLVRDPYFLVRIYEKYWEIRESVIEEMVREGGLIDQYAEELKPAADANDARWGGCLGDYEGQMFDEGIASMKTFLNERVQWLDLQFASVETLRTSLGYYKTSDTLTIKSIDTTSYENMTEVTVHVTSPDYKGVSFQVNGTKFYTADIENGEAIALIPNQDLRTEEGALNTIQVRALDEENAYITNEDGSVEGEYTNAVSNYTYFASK